MLYAVRYPLSFVVLVVTFVVGVSVRGAAQRMVGGQRRPAWVRANAPRRSSLWLRPFVDPYGCVAAALGGIGWGAPVDISATRTRANNRRVAQLLVGPAVLVCLGLGCLIGFRAWSHLTIGGSVLAAVTDGSLFTTGYVHYALPFGQVALFLAGVELLGMGVLHILPLPPLDGGKLLFALAPQTSGWQQARYRLDDENWGVLILLVIALPVLFRRILIISILGDIIDPLIRALG